MEHAVYFEKKEISFNVHHSRGYSFKQTALKMFFLIFPKILKEMVYMKILLICYRVKKLKSEFFKAFNFRRRYQCWQYF